MGRALDIDDRTDSGYASHRAASSSVGGQSPSKTTTTQVLGSNELDDDATASVSSVTEDVLSVYSAVDPTTADTTVIEAGINDLCDALLKHLREKDLQLAQLDRVADVLPSLLQSFAFRLGAPGSTEAGRFVMYYIHKYRRCVCPLGVLVSHVLQNMHR